MPPEVTAYHATLTLELETVSGDWRVIATDDVHSEVAHDAAYAGMRKEVKNDTGNYRMRIRTSVTTTNEDAVVFSERKS